MHRRRFLALFSGLGLGLGLSLSGRLIASPHSKLLLSAASDTNGAHFVLGMDADGHLHFQTRLPGRAHAIAIHPNGHQILAIARRPGRFIAVIDLIDGNLAQRISSPPDRHFYGHAVFSADARRLFSTENDYQTGAGRIGVRDVDNSYRQIAEWDSYGIGPHELLLADADTLVVANGGLRTHPDEGRRTLNPDSIAPSLAWLDACDGRLRASQTAAPKWRRASIRHIAALPDRHIAIAMQYQGDSRGQAPLVALAHPDHGWHPLFAPKAVQRSLHDYCGSVTADCNGQTFAVSAPRGNRVLFWSAAGDYLGEIQVKDGCGLAAGDHVAEFLISDGHGGLHRYDALNATQETLSEAPNWRYDNHLTRTR
ncbi:MAG: DUF1513 domain-containing protein [Gammaproteobacteria bacterium]|nr:DUF1513 domain-containing protein [Gammaproteobacteria bacterium]